MYSASDDAEQLAERAVRHEDAAFTQHVLSEIPQDQRKVTIFKNQLSIKFAIYTDCSADF